MPTLAPLALMLWSSLSACQWGAPPASDGPQVEMTLPDVATRQGTVTDDYFGTTVADPYRWLEDLDSEETTAWVTAQNERTRAHLDGMAHRDTIRSTLETLWTVERFGLPVERGGRVFATWTDGKADHAVLRVQDTLDGEPRVLLDPNTMSEDGTMALADWVPSHNGRVVAYGVADGGSDWRTWRIRDVETGADLDDTLQWLKFTSVSWLPDGSGFFYSRYPEPDEAFEASLSTQSVWFHRVATPQSADILVHEDPEHPSWGFGADVSEDGSRLFLTVWDGTEEKSRVYWKSVAELDLQTPGGQAGGTLHKPLDAFDANYARISESGDTAWFVTDNNAERSRVIAVDLTQPAPEHWTEVIAETPDNLLGVTRVGDSFYAQYLADASTVVRQHGLDGALIRTVALPGVGRAGGFDGDSRDSATTFSYQSFTTPPTIYRIDVASGESTLMHQPDVDVDLDSFVVSQERYPSKDGTEVNLFLVHRKDVEPNGERPTLLYGYGGFNIPLTPRYSAPTLAWVQMGGVYAVANLRGGGEYGRSWHEAGTKLQKQNVFDDFIAAGEHLIASGWTRADRLAINGRSNGGLLVGATLLQRPDLFGAAIPAVGVLDMLRYHKFTIGWAWASDYGTSADDEAMFKALLAYSPVHNTKAGTDYPATMILTGDHDDRVVPGHSYKYAAALQRDNSGKNPAVIRIETRAGHGAGTPKSMKIDELVDVYGFLFHHLDASPASP